MVVGLGATGMSYARYLCGRGDDFVVMDDQPSVARVAELHALQPGLEVQPVIAERLVTADAIYLSPGVPLSNPGIQQALAADVSVYGDVQMFGQMVKAPVISVTGTNGKSTVVELLYQMAQQQNINVALGGNIGTPCLDLLDSNPDLYVLEVSSYQLELASDLKSRLAIVLNLADDHLDRYPNRDAYFETKLALYKGSELAVVNRQLGYALPEELTGKKATFGLDPVSGESDFSLVDGQFYQGQQILGPANDLKILGVHNQLNVLACIAAGWLLGWDVTSMLQTAAGFGGLAHRSELVTESEGVSYINDSKATNPGAMVAAVHGQANGRNIHLIAGGDTKDLDFTEAATTIGGYLKSVQLIGKDPTLLQTAFAQFAPNLCFDMEQAVKECQQQAQPGDVVLLSPGCASFDQYQNYSERGETFAGIVRELTV